jgi:hypothetical protein
MMGPCHSGGWERQRLCDGIHLLHRLRCDTGGFPDDEWRRVDVFVTKLNATGTALVYSTYIGGSGDDVGYAIAVDGSGYAYVTGDTSSTDYDVTPGAFQTTNGGNTDVFVTKLNATGTALVYSTYIGGSGGDEGYGIAVDGSGNAYVTGLHYLHRLRC